MSIGNTPKLPGNFNGLKLSEHSPTYGSSASSSRDLEIASVFAFEELQLEFGAAI
jgi:hypothetical protein